MNRVVGVILLLAACIPLWAQQHRKSDEERRERLETVIIGKFAEELALSPEQAEKFYPRLRLFRTETEEAQRELMQGRRRLDALSVTDDATPAEVKALIARNSELQTVILAKREAMLTDMAEFLSPQQVSRCSVLLDELPRRMQQMMQERGRGPEPGEGSQRGLRKRY